jgi:hypothetical protein
LRLKLRVTPRRCTQRQPSVVIFLPAPPPHAAPDATLPYNRPRRSAPTRAMPSHRAAPDATCRLRTTIFHSSLLTPHLSYSSLILLLRRYTGHENLKNSPSGRGHSPPAPPGKLPSRAPFRAMPCPPCGAVPAPWPFRFGADMAPAYRLAAKTGGGGRGSPSNSSGWTECRCPGWRNGRPEPQCPNSRREPRGETPRTRPPDPSGSRNYNCRTSPSTTHTRSRAYHTAPTRWEQSSPPRLSYPFLRSRHNYRHTAPGKW